MSDLKITDIMTKEVISVDPEAPLFEAAKILADHNFNGMPVVDKENKLIGILTQYDFIHLPTLQKILKDMNVLGQDKSHFKKEFKDIIALKVKDAMNTEPLALRDDASYDEAVKTFREHHRVNPIPVINKEGKVVGVVSRYDIIKPLLITQ